MLKNRLLSIGVLLFLFGIIMIVFIGGIILPLCIVAVSVLCILLCTVRFFKLSPSKALIFSLLPALGAIYVLIYGNLFIMPFSVFDGVNDDITAKVVSVSGSHFDVSVSESNIGIPVGTKIRLYADADPMVGDIITFHSKLKCVRDKTLTASDIKLTTNVYRYRIESGSGFIYRFRKTVYDCFDTLPQKYSAFLKAIIFNDKASFGEERYTMYRISGAASFFAVSGLHIALIAMTLYNVLRYFGVGKTPCGIFAVASAVFYGILAGFTPAVFRSIFVIAFIALANIMTTEADSTTSLFVALGVLLVINPYSVASIGLQLSFSATLGAIYASGVFALKNRKKPLRSALIGIFVIPSCTSATCFVFMLPILFTSFDVISIASPISNIFLSLLFTPMLILTFVIILLASCALPIIAPIRYPVMLLINIFDSICSFMSSNIKLILTSNNIFAAIASVLAFSAFLSVLLLSKKKRRIAFITSCLLIVPVFFGGMLFLNHQSQTACKLSYKQFGEGYSAIAICNGDKYYIDCGAFDTSFIYSQNITDIDVYVVRTHRENIASDLSYAIRRFGVNKIILLSDEFRDDVFAIADSHDVQISIEPYINVGTEAKGIVIENDGISLYNNLNTFLIADSGKLSEFTDFSGLIITSPSVIYTDKQIHKCEAVFSDENINISSELSPLVTQLERNMNVVVSAVADNIEVTVNES